MRHAKQPLARECFLQRTGKRLFALRRSPANAEVRLRERSVAHSLRLTKKTSRQLPCLFARFGHFEKAHFCSTPAHYHYTRSPKSASFSFSQQAKIHPLPVVCARLRSHRLRGGCFFTSPCIFACLRNNRHCP